MENNERQHILNVAPAEGNGPLSVFRDEYSEELAYPRILLGQPQQETKQRKATVNYSAICKNHSEEGQTDELPCVLKKFSLKQRSYKWKSFYVVDIPLRKCKRNNTNISAGQLKQQGELDRLIHHDEGFKS